MKPISNKAKSKINELLNVISKKYFKNIPLEEIFTLLENNNVKVVQEDGTDWEGLLCGTEGNVVFSLKCRYCNENISNSLLVLNWFKMPSGNFEITTYLS